MRSIGVRLCNEESNRQELEFSDSYRLKGRTCLGVKWQLTDNVEQIGLENDRET